jgi:hypothetical protein
MQARLARDIFLRYVAPVLLRFRAVRTVQFRLVSQTRIHYRDSSALSSGTAGKIHGGDRLPWVQSQDNFQPLTSLSWQLHVYGAISGALQDLANRWNVPVHSFSWDKKTHSAGLIQNAAYLVRPDGHVALVQPEQDPRQMENYFSQRLISPAS